MQSEFKKYDLFVFGRSWREIHPHEMTLDIFFADDDDDDEFCDKSLR